MVVYRRYNVLGSSVESTSYGTFTLGPQHLNRHDWLCFNDKLSLDPLLQGKTIVNTVWVSVILYVYQKVLSVLDFSLSLDLPFSL